MEHQFAVKTLALHIIYRGAKEMLVARRERQIGDPCIVHHVRYVRGGVPGVQIVHGDFAVGASDGQDCFFEGVERQFGDCRGERRSECGLGFCALRVDGD